MVSVPSSPARERVCPPSKPGGGGAYADGRLEIKPIPLCLLLDLNKSTTP